MHIGSTEILSILAHRRGYILYEKGAPYTRLKRDVITLKEGDGRDLGVEVPSPGFRSGRLELPRAIFEDFARASLIQQDGPEDGEHRIVFRLTEDGRQRGLSVPLRT